MFKLFLSFVPSTFVCRETLVLWTDFDSNKRSLGTKVQINGCIEHGQFKLKAGFLPA